VKGSPEEIKDAAVPLLPAYLAPENPNISDKKNNK